MPPDVHLLVEAIDRLIFVVAFIGVGTVLAIIGLTVAVHAAVRSVSRTRR